MSVWFAIPSCRPAAEAGPLLDKWREQGYRIALLRQGEPVGASIEVPADQYYGWAASINTLAKIILERDPEAKFIVSGGDDTLPDPDHTAQEIAEQCLDHFAQRFDDARGMWPLARDVLHGDANLLRSVGPLFAVMQPIGDLKAWPNSRIDTFAGSPWLGREWCRRAYGGNGPLFAGYPHSWADEELQAVAIKLGVFWQRPDLTHAHLHYLREKRPAPAYADMINRDYGTHRPLFEQRKAAGWPGHEPLA